MEWGTIGTLAAIISTAIIIYDRRAKKKKALEAPYEIIWRHALAIKPKDLLGIRAESKFGFRKYYYFRACDDEIKERIEKGENVLVVGHSLAGKTRAVYEAIKACKGNLYVTIPRLAAINLSEFKVPILNEPNCRKVLILNDIDKFYKETNFSYLLNAFREKGVQIVATCRSGPELEYLIKMMDNIAMFSKPVEIHKVSDEEAREVSSETGATITKGFDHNIGSLFLPLEEMIKRFNTSTDEEKEFLKSMKRLFYAGIYEGREVFYIGRIKMLCEKKGLRKEEYELDGLIDGLAMKGFLEKKKNMIETEEAYLERVVADDFDLLENLKEMIEVYTNDPWALHECGARAWNIGLKNIRKADFMKTAIDAYRKALEHYSDNKESTEYATTQSNLGNAYRALSEVKDIVDNCNKAIKVFVEALKVFTFDKFPLQYATTQNNLGAAYQTLAQVKGKVEEKADYCNKAIKAFEKALIVCTFAKFPMDFARIQNNLSTVYGLLAQVENKADNCYNAIEAAVEALEVFTSDKYPWQYATTQNNLGIAYGALAAVEAKAEEKADYCNKAINVFDKALRIQTFQDSPIDYAMIQCNLGAVYKMLSDVKDKAVNCKKSIDSFGEALKFCNGEEHPVAYEKIIHNLDKTLFSCKEALNLKIPESNS